MKLEFKFNLFGILTFVILCGLFYAFVPLPANLFWRAFLCGLVAAVLFGMCFVVVTHKGPIRRK